MGCTVKDVDCGGGATELPAWWNGPEPQTHLGECVCDCWGLNELSGWHRSWFPGCDIVVYIITEGVATGGDGVKGTWEPPRPFLPLNLPLFKIESKKNTYICSKVQWRPKCISRKILWKKIYGQSPGRDLRGPECSSPAPSLPAGRARLRHSRSVTFHGLLIEQGF